MALVAALPILLGAVSSTAAGDRSAWSLDPITVVRLSTGKAEQLYPSALTFDAQGGEICVTENRGRAIHLLNEAGVEHFRTLRLAGLRNPQDACLAADGSLFVLDLGPEGRGMVIRRLNLFGEPEAFAVRPPATGWSPQHLTVAPSGELISLDSVSGLLAAHDPASGEPRWAREIFMGESFDLGLGRPACAEDGRIFVPGGETHQVHVFDADGGPLGSFGEFGTGPGRLVFPVGVAFGPEGTVLVLDRMRHKILIFDESLAYVGEVGQAGIWPGQFYHPLAITALDGGRVVVSQGYQSRVQIFALRKGGRN